MKKRLRLLFFYLFLFCLSCTREVSVQLPGPVVAEGQISGQVILPQNTKADTTGLVVLSGSGSSIPVASKFAIDTTGKVSTTVLNNAKGEVLLLGYNYPGQTDYSISSESTALALLMNTLTLRSLSTAGKLEMIDKIKKDPIYQELVKQISLGLQSGRAVTDTTNKELMQAIAAVFKSSTGLRTTATAGYSNPVKITTANTEVMLQNNNVAHTYVAGVYKDNKAVGPKYVIGGRTLFATSLAEAAAGVFGDGYGMPSPAQFTLSGDGEYTIKIRSGKPSEGDETLESRMARNENVHRFLFGILRDIFPLADDCGTAVLESIPVTLKGIMDKRESVLATANSPEVFAALALDITGEALETATDLLEDCDVDDNSFKFLRSLGKTFSLLGIATKFMTAANITAHTNDLFQAKASIDSCFQVVGMKLVKCGEQAVYLVDTVSGSNQKGESGKALKGPLVVKVRTEDGKPAIKATVSWVVKSGGGKVSSEETETSYDGIAQVTWTPGPGKGVQQVEAYVNKAKGSTTATFQATAFDGNDRKAEIASGNNQTGQYGKELAKPLTIRVLNGEGKPEAGVEVTWKILAGGGDFGNLQRITNAEGLVSANWKLGPSGGQNVEVIVKKKDGTPAVGSPVVFTANGGSSSLKDLIVGEWWLIRMFGTNDGLPDEDDWSDSTYYCVKANFKADGSYFERYVDWDYPGEQFRDDIEISTGFFEINESTRSVTATIQTNARSFVFENGPNEPIVIQHLSQSKLVLSYPEEDGDKLNLEFMKLTNSGGPNRKVNINVIKNPPSLKKKKWINQFIDI
jgi:hypothetical protein